MLDLLPLIDIHTHLPFNTKHILAIHSHSLHIDFEPEPHTRYAVGLHPWFLKQCEPEVALNTLQNIASHPQIWAIGEAGIDRKIDTALSEQNDIFVKQIHIAEKYQKPMIIHCVKAYSDILGIHKSLHPTQAWIWHGYTGNQIIAEQIISRGGFLSFGKWLFEEKSKIPELFKILPLEHIFLETDDDPLDIEDVYIQAAKLKNISLESLQKQISINFASIFK
jgi:TatD DNase family protein